MKLGLKFVCGILFLIGFAAHSGAQATAVAGGSGASNEAVPAPALPAALGSPASIAAQATPAGGAQLPGSIEGVVVSSNGEVYEGARVELEQAGPSSPNGSTSPNGTTVRVQVSDGDGAFSFLGVSAGPFRLTISSDGFETQVISGALHAGESFDAHTIALPMAAASSEVQVSASDRDISQEVLHEEEQQRVFGVIPNFYVSYSPNAPPLSKGQKYQLAWKSSIDPITWLTSGVVAGIQQAQDSFSGYGPGAQGYAKRFGANYADTFIGTFIGGAILPSLLKQDPRYFYKGTGTVGSRTLYAIANAVICKGDNGHWQFNYSAVAGGLAAAGISNLYYPASNRNGISLTVENTMVGFGTSAIQNLFQEFVVRRLTPKLPSFTPPTSQ